MQGWEYLFVAAYPSRGTHRANRVNGQHLERWEDGPTIYEYAQDRGDDGWELVSANTIPFLKMELSYHFVFKRPKSTETPREPERPTQRLR